MKAWFILFFGLLSAVVAAQDTRSFNYENENLSVVLADLERAYAVKFSYRTTSVQDKLITLHIEAAGLDQILLELQGQLNIVINKIDERYYVVKPSRSLTVCGYIKDGAGGHMVEGSSITTKSRTKGTVSDTEGFFRLEKVDETDTLQISFIGFRTIELPVKRLDHERCEMYRLTPENYRLNEVVVQEYLVSGMTKTRDGAIKINPNDLDILSGLPEPDILQNTQLLPGIESPSESASGLFIRGGSPDQNLILWDGIKMYSSNHFFGMISAFNPYITKEVRIYRGGVKPEYGDRVSGVVDIGTDNEVPVKTEGGFGLNMTHADMYLKIPLSKDFGLLLSARRSIKDVINTPTFDNFSKKVFQNTGITQNQSFFLPEFSRRKEDFYFTDITLKSMLRLSQKDRISISNILTKNKLDYIYKDIDFAVDSSDKLSIQNFGTNATWERSWSDTFSSKSRLYYSEYDFKYNGRNQNFEQNSSISKENSVKEFGVNFHTDWNLDGELTFSNGYQYFSNQVSYSLGDSDFNAGANQNSPTHGLYSQLNYTRTDKWYLDIGLRANYYTRLKSVNLQPRFYAERLIGKHFRIKSSAEVKSQAISQVIEFATADFGLENQVWALTAETDSPLLISDQYSLGFLVIKKGWHLDLDAYYKRIDGLNSFTRGFESTEDFFSEGKSTTKGIDILMKKKLDDYSTWLGYTYSITDFSFAELNQGKTFRGNNDITHSLTWAHSYKWKNFQFSLGWKYRTGIPYSKPSGTKTEDESTFIEYTTVNNFRLPEYHRLDFSALYELNLSKTDDSLTGTFGFSILNLYGRENLLSKNYALFGVTDVNDEQTLELGEVNRFSLRTTPNVMVRISF